MALGRICMGWGWAFRHVLSDFSRCSRSNFLQVFGDLYPSAMQLQMVSVASVLEAMGYEMKVRP